MNRYEAILLDKMVASNLKLRDGIILNLTDEERERLIRDILLLLDCICDFREPPRALDVADGYGAMAVVDGDGEVVV